MRSIADQIPHHSYAVVVNGYPGLSGGTSAAVPVFASVIALLNDARFRAGKSALGFINPWREYIICSQIQAFQKAKAETLTTFLQSTPQPSRPSRTSRLAGASAATASTAKRNSRSWAAASFPMRVGTRRRGGIRLLGWGCRISKSCWRLRWSCDGLKCLNVYSNDV